MDSKTRQASAPCTATGFSRWDALALLVLALLVAVSYFPATQAGFVWDDKLVTTLTAIRDWGGIAELWFAPGSAYLQGAVGEGHYWPMTYSTFWLEHKLWGLAPTGYHVVNILLHFANTALLWCLLRRLCVPGAWLVAAVFAVHPLHVESVAWIIERKDVLSALFYLTAVLRKQERYEEADEYLLRVRELKPHDLATLQSTAEILRKQGHHEEAIASYRVVLEIDPEHALAYAGMGDALFQLERYEEVLASLTQAISLQSDLPMAARLHVLMGQASQELGRTKVAAEQYERALLVEPHNTEALDHLAFVRFGQKRYEEALGLYRTLIDIGHAKAQNHTNMAASLFYLGRTDEAIQNLERALSLNPNLESAQTYLKDMRLRQ